MSSINYFHSVSCLGFTQRQRYARQIYRLSLFLLLVALGNLATAGTFLAYGPETFQRTHSEISDTFEASFNVLNPNASYTLEIYSGGIPGSETTGRNVTAATIYINGQKVAGPNLFHNKKTTLVTIPVNLQADNHLALELKGKPTSLLTLQIIGEDNEPPVITATGLPEPTSAGWNNSSVTVSFDCSDAISGIASCSDPVSIDSEGANQTVTGTASDNAGNTATTSVDLNIDQTSPVISASLSPSPNAAGWNNTDVTVSFTATDVLSGIVEITDPVNITTEGGGQGVTGTATDAAGNSASITATVNLDKTPPQLSISSPADGSDVITDSIEVTGTATDNTSIARVIVNGVDATLNGDSFSAIIPLSEGDNSITITAVDQADNEASASLSVAYVFPVTIQIIEPATLITVGSTPIEVNGSVSDPAASLTVNGAPVDNGNGTFTAQVSLEEGLNTIVARAVNSQGAEVTDSIVVSMDLTPPYITVESPLDGQTVSTAAVSVSGLVNDIVRGTIAEDQANVLVNGIQATVANRSYLAENIPLQTGDNQITVSASDQVGNTATTGINIRYELPALRHIELASGQGQQAQIRSALPDPLTVLLIGDDGQPVPANNVVFRVIQGDGVLQVGVDTPAQGVLAVTDGNGIAQAGFNLGSRSGVGNHRVRATAVGFDGEVIFHASANANPGDKVSVNSGNNQRGAINQPLPQPFVVAVTDEGANVVQGAQVEFGVTRGGGKFQNDATTYTTQTDSDGRATAHLTVGSEVGFDVHRVSATLVGTSLNAGFTASALQTGDAGNTRITGVVFDNQDTPLPGVTIRVDGTTRQAETDEQGQFLITEVPVGPVHLLADGSTTIASGEWPTLSYNLVTIAGAENPLPSPVYMVRLDTENAVLVGREDRVITLPELPGFELEVRAGSVTFPDGSHEGLMSVTPVNADKVPMAPPNGMQPQFIVTIQPTGTRFDPPAPLTLPNVDGHLPGAQVEMYSYDHDLEEFVSIGLGTVSTDGSVIRSNNGIGVIKAGWHCGSQPVGSGCADACPTCKKCDGNCNCVAEDDNKSCEDGKYCTSSDGLNPGPDDCQGGECKGENLTFPKDFTASQEYDFTKLKQLLDGATLATKFVPGCTAGQAPSITGAISIGLTKSCCEDEKRISDADELSGSVSVKIPAFECRLPVFTYAGLVTFTANVGLGGNGTVTGTGIKDDCTSTCGWNLGGSVGATLSGALGANIISPDVVEVTAGIRGGGTFSIGGGCGDVSVSGCVGPPNVFGTITLAGLINKEISTDVYDGFKACF